MEDIYIYIYIYIYIHTHVQDIENVMGEYKLKYSPQNYRDREDGASR